MSLTKRRLEYKNWASEKKTRETGSAIFKWDGEQVRDSKQNGYWVKLDKVMQAAVGEWIGGEGYGVEDWELSGADLGKGNGDGEKWIPLE